MNIGNHCQKGYDKAGNNTSYDHLVTSIDDPLIPGKIMIFEELANKMNKLLTLFWTDQHVAPFLAEIFDGLVRFFMEKFILKSVMGKLILPLFSQKLTEMMSLSRNIGGCRVFCKLRDKAA